MLVSRFFVLTSQLAYCLGPWFLGTTSFSRPLSAVHWPPGVPSMEQLLKHYTAAANQAYPLPDWPKYLSFVAFKVGAIMVSLISRSQAGTSVSTRFDQAGSQDVLAVVTRGHQLFKGVVANPSAATSAGSLFPLSERARDILSRLRAFLDAEVWPAEPTYAAQLASNRWSIPPILEQLKQKAKSAGLWNLFLPAWSGLTNAEYAPMAELMGRNLWAAEVFNCQFPDTGNMETLHLFGSAHQQAEWLEPLKAGLIRSAFAMTEPGVASSDGLPLTFFSLLPNFILVGLG